MSADEVELPARRASAMGLRLLVSEAQGRWNGRAIGMDGREVWNAKYARASVAAVRTAFNLWARDAFVTAPMAPTEAHQPELGTVGLVERLALLVSSLDVQSIRISALIDKADMIFDRAERVLKELS